MRLLVVSRLTLHNNIIRQLRKFGEREFVDYFKHRHTWKDEKDIMQVFNMEGCDSVAVISNFSLAVRLLVHGVKRVYVLVPRLFTLTEIVCADIYKITGTIQMEKARV